MSDPTRIRVLVQASGLGAVVRVLVSHAMETGQRKDESGKPVPAWYITDVTAALNGKTVLGARWGTAIAKNPFLEFTLKGAKSGDTVSIRWTDNHGDTRSDDAVIA